MPDSSLGCAKELFSGACKCTMCTGITVKHVGRFSVLMEDLCSKLKYVVTTASLKLLVTLCKGFHCCK
jgi:hypothetical protein